MFDNQTIWQPGQVPVSASKRLEAASLGLQHKLVAAKQEGKRFILLNIRRGDLVELHSVLSKTRCWMQRVGGETRFVEEEAGLLNLLTYRTSTTDLDTIVYHGPPLSLGAQDELTSVPPDLLPSRMILTLNETFPLNAWEWDADFEEIVLLEPMRWTSLIDRRGDISDLFRCAVVFLANKLNKPSIVIDPAMEKHLRVHDWPKTVTATDVLNVAIPFFS